MKALRDVKVSFVVRDSVAQTHGLRNPGRPKSYFEKNEAIGLVLRSSCKATYAGNVRGHLKQFKASTNGDLNIRTDRSGIMYKPMNACFAQSSLIDAPESVVKGFCCLKLLDAPLGPTKGFESSYKVIGTNHSHNFLAF